MRADGGVKSGADLKTLLPERRDALLSKWFDETIASYPEETGRFLKNRKDRFDNPVGFTIYEGLGGILDGVLKGADSGEVSPFLDNIIRVRAIQDFTASGAVAFIFRLKGMLADELGESHPEVLPALNSRIDELALLSFDIYMKCREKVYDLKANDLRRMTFRLLQRANLISEQAPAEEAADDNKEKG